MITPKSWPETLNCNSKLVTKPKNIITISKYLSLVWDCVTPCVRKKTTVSNFKFRSFWYIYFLKRILYQSKDISPNFHRGVYLGDCSSGYSKSIFPVFSQIFPDFSPIFDHQNIKRGGSSIFRSHLDTPLSQNLFIYFSQC